MLELEVVKLTGAIESLVKKLDELMQQTAAMQLSTVDAEPAEKAPQVLKRKAAKIARDPAPEPVVEEEKPTPDPDPVPVAAVEPAAELTTDRHELQQMCLKAVRDDRSIKDKIYALLAEFEGAKTINALHATDLPEFSQALHDLLKVGAK